MTNFSKKSKIGIVSWVIIVLSIAVPGIVAILYFGSDTLISSNQDFSFLPRLNAALNLSTFFILILGRYFITTRRRAAHKLSMLSAVFLSTLFLVSYLTYHATTESTHYGGENMLRYVYYVLLISHIFLAATLLPFVLITLVRALRGDFVMHRKIAKITWLMWIYVCLSGVLVYLMISPYYP